MGVGSKARFVGREEAPRRDRYLDYAEGKTRQFKPGSFARSGSFTNSGTRDGLQPTPGADNNGGCSDIDDNGRGSGTGSDDHRNNKQRPELGRDTQPKVAPPQRVVGSYV